MRRVDHPLDELLLGHHGAVGARHLSQQLSQPGEGAVRRGRGLGGGPHEAARAPASGPLHEALHEPLMKGIAQRVLDAAGALLPLLGFVQPARAVADVRPDADGGQPVHQRVDVSGDVIERRHLPGQPGLVQLPVTLGELEERLTQQRDVLAEEPLAEVRNLADLPQQLDHGAGLVASSRMAGTCESVPERIEVVRALHPDKGGVARALATASPAGPPGSRSRARHCAR